MPKRRTNMEKRTQRGPRAPCFFQAVNRKI
nr:MAG TPA: hypothetical protein [Caudoviricetes sp.]